MNNYITSYRQEALRKFTTLKLTKWQYEDGVDDKSNRFEICS